MNGLSQDCVNQHSRVAHNLNTIQERILLACQRCGRDPKQVKLLAVSKTKPATAVQEAVTAGQLLFGENRVMEARDKIPLVERPQAQWHLIGPLQRNKAKVAAKLFHMVHSIDSLALAQTLSQRCDALKPLPILIQVNIGQEAQKHGVAGDEVERLARSIAQLPGLVLHGLMAIPPRTEQTEQARPHFQALATLARQIEQQAITGVQMNELSMGMSHDFEIAIEEGATLVRVGSALFGKRS